MFAAAGDGKSAIFECSCTQVQRVDLNDGFLAGTNHYQYLPVFNDWEYKLGIHQPAEHFDKSAEGPPGNTNIQRSDAILADPGVEQYQTDYGTVYSNLYETSGKQLWFTFGGFPAASRGNWQPVPWPF